MLAKANALQSMLAVGVYTMRRTCNGYATGSHCEAEICHMCKVMGVHRDLESLIAQSEVSNSPSGKCNNINIGTASRESFEYSNHKN